MDIAQVSMIETNKHEQMIRVAQSGEVIILEQSRDWQQVWSDSEVTHEMQAPRENPECAAEEQPLLPLSIISLRPASSFASQ